MGSCRIQDLKRSWKPTTTRQCYRTLSLPSTINISITRRITATGDRCRCGPCGSMRSSDLPSRLEPTETLDEIDDEDDFEHAADVAAAGAVASNTRRRLRLSYPLHTLRIAAIQAGGASVHHHHRGGAAFRAELCTIGKMRLRKGIGLFRACFELCALFPDQLALMDIQFGFLEQTDGL